MIAWHEGNQMKALQAQQLAAEIFEAIGDTRMAIEMRVGVPGIMGDLGLVEEALHKLVPLMAAVDRLGLGYLCGFVRYGLCALFGQVGRFDEMRAMGEQALALARQQGDPRLEGMILVALSLGAWREERFREAESHARKAIRSLATVLPALPSAQATLAQALLCQGRAEEALAVAEEGHRLFKQMGQVEDGEALLRLVYGDALLAVGRAQEGRAVLADAVRRLEERAAMITNPDWRQAFLRLPAHAATLARAAER
jgi:tetratricopeptide (TPR) repeat protein